MTTAERYTQAAKNIADGAMLAMNVLDLRPTAKTAIYEAVKGFAMLEFASLMLADVSDTLTRARKAAERIGGTCPPISPRLQTLALIRDVPDDEQREFTGKRMPSEVEL